MTTPREDARPLRSAWCLDHAEEEVIIDRKHIPTYKVRAMMTTPREDAIAAHGPLPRFGTDYIDCVCGWEAPRKGVIVWWGHVRAALGAAAETPSCSICSHGPDPHYTGCMECDRYGRAHTR